MENNREGETKKNISKGETVRTYCNKCKQDMNHQVIMDYYERDTVVHDSYIDPEYGRSDCTVDFSHDYQIVKCSGCDTVSYRSFNYCSEHDVQDDGTWEERFPAPQKRTKKDFKYLPPVLRNIYQEVITIYNYDGFILCAAGIRALLEGICKEKGITDGKLEKKIDALREQELVSKQQESILHGLRFLGNDALHDLQVPSLGEIDVALDIIEHIVDDIYEITEKADILKQKASKEKSENKTVTG